MAGKSVYSKQTAHVAVGDGSTRFLVVGEILSADDPIVAAYPSMFTEDGEPFQRGNFSQSAISGVPGAPEAPARAEAAARASKQK